MKKKKALIVYHRADYDGIFSGIITKRYCKDKYDEIELLGWNYRDEVPEIKEGDYDTVYMVDISWPDEDMLKLFQVMGNNFVWIDHHITAINSSEEYGYSNAQGMRGMARYTAACKLCHLYFNPKEEVPELIELLSNYDTWNKKGRFDWMNEVVALQTGLRDKYELNFKKLEENYDNLVNTGGSDVMEVGRLLLNYDLSRYKVVVKNNSFPVTVDDGRYNGICLITPEMRSIVFDSVKDEYDLFVIACPLSDGKIKIQISTEKAEKLDIILGEYVKKYNPSNGGHAGIGAGIIDLETFNKLITERVI